MAAVFEYYPFKRMNDPDEWLRIALGDADEVARAMKLPTELRQAVYSEIYTYGPAAPRVVEFASCLEKIAPTHDAWMLLGQLHEFMNSKPAQTWVKYGRPSRDNESRQSLLGRWGLTSTGVRKLEVNFHVLCRNGGGFRGPAFLSAATVMMFFTGEYLFPKNVDGVVFVEAMSGATPLINQVLRSLDLAPVDGRLANSNLLSEALRV